MANTIAAFGSTSPIEKNIDGGGEDAIRLSFIRFHSLMVSSNPKQKKTAG